MNRIARIALHLISGLTPIAAAVIAAVLAEPHIRATGNTHTAWLAIFACLGMCAGDALISRLADPIADHLDRRKTTPAK